MAAGTLGRNAATGNPFRGDTVDLADPYHQGGAGFGNPTTQPSQYAPTPASAPANYGYGQTIPGDFNLQGPGVAEQQFNPAQYSDPFFGEQNAQGLVQGGMGMTGAANPTAQAYDQFQQNRPDIAQDPGLGAYYENAKRRSLEDINKQAAARGAYGSSAALDVGQEAVTNLEAERANREAQYNLQRLGEQRAWEGLGGQLAGQQAGSQLGWTQGLGQLGFGADQSRLGRQLGGQGAAGMAQGAREGRIQNAFQNLQGMGQQVSGQVLDWNNLSLGSDAALMDAIQGGNLSVAQEQAAAEEARRRGIETGIADAVNIGTSIAAV